MSVDLVSSSAPAPDPFYDSGGHPSKDTSVVEYSRELMAVVEDQVNARLATESGRRILEAEAVYYGGDLERTQAAIIKCAKLKLRKRLRRAVSSSSKGRRRKSSSRNSGRRSSRRATSAEKQKKKKHRERTPNARQQRACDEKQTGDQPSSASRRGSTQADAEQLNSDIAAEAEALGLRVQDIPFNANDLVRISGRRLSREPGQMQSSATQAAAAAATSEVGVEGTNAAAAAAPTGDRGDSSGYRGSGRGPVFGKGLAAALVCNATNPGPDAPWVPDVVQKSLDFLNAHALDTEGLWRIPGNVGKVKEYRRAWDIGMGVPYADRETRPHDVCSLLLLYFRELPGGVFGEAADDFVNNQDLKEEDEIVDRLSGLVMMLPKANRDTLAAMIRHFMLLSAQSESNMMTSENIATCVWASQGYYQSMKHMIDNYDLIFYMYA